MAGATDYLGLILVADGENVDPDVLNSNNKAIDAQFEKLKYSSGTYIPNFAGISNIGTGSTKLGSYMRIGRLVIASFSLKAGTGASLGNTSFLSVSLPFNAAVGTEKVDFDMAGLHSPGISGTIFQLVTHTNPGTKDLSIWAINGADKNQFMHPGQKAYPFLNGDYIRGSITYLTDDA